MVTYIDCVGAVLACLCVVYELSVKGYFYLFCALEGTIFWGHGSLVTCVYIGNTGDQQGLSQVRRAHAVVTVSQLIECISLHLLYRNMCFGAIYILYANK